MGCIAVIVIIVVVVKITAVIIASVTTVTITAIFTARVLARNKVNLTMLLDVFDWRNLRLEKPAAHCLQQSRGLIVALSYAILSLGDFHEIWNLLWVDFIYSMSAFVSLLVRVLLNLLLIQEAAPICQLISWKPSVFSFTREIYLSLQVSQKLCDQV